MKPKDSSKFFSILLLISILPAWNLPSPAQIKVTRIEEF